MKTAPSNFSFLYVLSPSFVSLFRHSLRTIPKEAEVLVSWYSDTPPPQFDSERQVQIIVPKQLPIPTFNRSYALNVAAQHASTDWLVISDADMLFPRFFLEAIRDSLSEDRITSFFIARMTPEFTQRVTTRGLDWEAGYSRYSGKQPRRLRGCLERILDEVVTRLDPGSSIVWQRYSRDFSHIYGSMNPSVFSKELFRKVRGYDERITGWGSEDVDLANRMKERGAREVRAPMVVGHLFHPTPSDFPEYTSMRKQNRAIAAQSPQREVNPLSWGDISDVNDAAI